MKLVVVSHVRHYRHAGRVSAYAPYARELQLWAELFDEIAVAAPVYDGEPTSDCAVIPCSNIRLLQQMELGGTTWPSKLKLAFGMLPMAWGLCRAFRGAEAIHVRCPGNLGLLGALLAPLFSRNIVAKFAGQWNPHRTEALSVRFQRELLNSFWWRGPVTVYGVWPNQKRHVVSFFSSALTDEQMEQAAEATRRRTPEQEKNILFVGRLSKSKNVNILIEAVARLRTEGVPCNCTIAGAGPEGPALEELTAKLSLGDSVRFTGGLGFDQVLELYKRSGILVLASDTEGWPKALAEGMAFGLIAIGSDVGWIPTMLAEGRGFTVPPKNTDALTATLRQILAAPEECSAMRGRASAWARSYSLDSLRESLRTLLSEHWGMRIESSSHPISSRSAACVHD